VLGFIADAVAVRVEIKEIGRAVIVEIVELRVACVLFLVRDGVPVAVEIRCV